MNGLGYEIHSWQLCVEENVCHWWYQQSNDDLIYNLTSDTS
jgi:hypothetical protein